MKKRTKIFLFGGLAALLIAGAGTFIFIREIRSADYAYARSLDALHRGDGDAMLRWMVIAGTRGHLPAQMQLATGFETGAFGGIKDDRLAAEWYRRAAEAGDPVAQFNYGTFCWTGRGETKIDRARTIFWWEKAAAADLSNAQINLGICFRDGVGVEKDRSRALELLTEAATKKVPEAQYQLGIFFEKGNDTARALFYHEKAAEQGHEKAKERFEALSGTYF